MRENYLILALCKTHKAVWDSMNPGECSQKAVTIKDGRCLVTSIETGLCKVCSAEDYINKYLAPVIVQNIMSPAYRDSWTTGRVYDIQKIVKSDHFDYEADPFLLKYVTLLKAVATESIKSENRSKIYQINVSLDDDYLEYNSLNDNNIVNLNNLREIAKDDIAKKVIELLYEIEDKE